MGLLALPLLLDKAIAHTGWIGIKPMMAVQTNDVVLLLSSSQHRNFARISSTKIISITPLIIKNHSLATTVAKNLCENNKDVLFYQVNC